MIKFQSPTAFDLIAMVVYLVGILLTVQRRNKLGKVTLIASAGMIVILIAAAANLRMMDWKTVAIANGAQKVSMADNWRVGSLPLQILLVGGIVLPVASVFARKSSIQNNRQSDGEHGTENDEKVAPQVEISLKKLVGYSVLCFLVEACLIAFCCCSCFFDFRISVFFDEYRSILFLAVPAIGVLCFSVYSDSPEQASRVAGLAWSGLTLYSVFHYAFNVVVGSAFPVSRGMFAILLLPFAIPWMVLTFFLGALNAFIIWKRCRV